MRRAAAPTAAPTPSPPPPTFTIPGAPAIERDENAAANASAEAEAAPSFEPGAAAEYGSEYGNGNAAGNAAAAPAANEYAEYAPAPAANEYGAYAAASAPAYSAYGAYDGASPATVVTTHDAAGGGPWGGSSSDARGFSAGANGPSEPPPSPGFAFASSSSSDPRPAEWGGGAQYASTQYASTPGVASELPAATISSSSFAGVYSGAGSSHASGDAGTPRSPHGRPSHRAFAFGFGGRIASAAPGYPGRDDAAGLVSTFALRDFLEDAATGTDAGRRYVRAWTREPGGPVRRNASRAELARLAERFASDARAAGTTTSPLGGDSDFGADSARESGRVRANGPPLGPPLRVRRRGGRVRGLKRRGAPVRRHPRDVLERGRGEERRGGAPERSVDAPRRARRRRVRGRVRRRVRRRVRGPRGRPRVVEPLGGSRDGGVRGFCGGVVGAVRVSASVRIARRGARFRPRPRAARARDASRATRGRRGVRVGGGAVRPRVVPRGVAPPRARAPVGGRAGADVVSGGFGEKGVASFEHSAQQRGPAGTVVETHHHHHPGGGDGGGGVEGVLAMLPRWREHVAALASNPAEGTGRFCRPRRALARARRRAKAHVAYVPRAPRRSRSTRARACASSARTTGGSRGRSTPTRTPSGARNSWSTRAAS